MDFTGRDIFLSWFIGVYTVTVKAGVPDLALILAKCIYGFLWQDQRLMADD
jgi:hypothetical protein